ncbi:hypothetical protein BRADI_2g23961v3 [Brachypodium distachyon]|uniref:Uncharacterized protein n=1 Tax=Brachypodium distachyon TaxID=15368 RepID=A0A2K2DA71_BRADI|nr:hypothetical protein BRADI_2g23961v3 [Brachypodium distachyon]
MLHSTFGFKGLFGSLPTLALPINWSARDFRPLFGSMPNLARPARARPCVNFANARAPRGRGKRPPKFWRPNRT